VSLFGKLVPLTQPSMQIPPEVTAILGNVLEDAGVKSPNRKLCYEQLREFHDQLDVVMFDEILTYLPAKHLDAFVKMIDDIERIVNNRLSAGVRSRASPWFSKRDLFET
jgi:hypothetical protein